MFNHRKFTIKCQNIKNDHLLLPIFLLVFLIAVPFINMLIPPTSTLHFEYGATKDYSFIEIVNTLVLIGLAILSLKIALIKDPHERNRVFWKIIAVGFVVLSLEELTDFLGPLYNVYLINLLDFIFEPKYEFMVNDDLFDVIELFMVLGFFCYVFKTEKFYFKAKLFVFLGFCAHISYVLFDLADEEFINIPLILIAPNEYIEELAQLYTFGFYFLAFYYILSAQRSIKALNSRK